MADTGQGYKFQLGAIAHVASLLSRDKAVKDYRIFYKLEEFKPFDIILAVNYTGSDDFRLHFVQLRCGAKVAIEINEYLKVFIGVTQNNKLSSFKDVLSIEEKDTQYWYLTTRQLLKSLTFAFVEDSEKKNLDLQEGRSILDGSVCKKLYLKDGNSTKFQAFFDNFYIYPQQPDTKPMAAKLREEWKLSDALQVTVYLEKYFKDVGADLSKTTFEHELLRMRLSNYIVTPVKVTPFRHDSSDAWINLTLSRDVTIVGDSPHAAVRLFGCIAQKIGDVITLDEWNDICANNKGILTQSVRTKCWSKTSKPRTIKDLILQCWISKKIPLILKSVDDLPALGDFAFLKQHYIIIDSKSNLNKRYDRMISYNLSVIKDLSPPQAGELLRSIPVSMQGKRPTPLYEVIGGDANLSEALACSDVLKLMEPRRVYLKRECFDRITGVLFVIGTADAEEYYEMIGDNILMYCPRDDSDVYYEAARRDAQFKHYRIHRLYSLNLEERGEDDTTGLEYYYVDQFGDNVYRVSGNEGVPILGETTHIQCARYLNRSMRIGEGPHFHEDDFFNISRRKICVVTGEPGIGKSTFLRSLVRTSPYYAVFCDLSRYRTDLSDKRKKQFKLCGDPLDFLRNQDQDNSPYRELLSALKADPKRLVIILDALDEIVATCKRSVLQMIDTLNRNESLGKIIIGSRLLTVDLIGDRFEIDRVEIEGLSLDYLRENWKINEDYIGTVPAEFLRNPMYLNFLQTISAGGESLDRWNLYESLMELSIKLYYERQNEFPDENDKKNILRYCYALSLEAFLPGNSATMKLVENIKEKHTNFARISIIRCFDEDGAPVFIHKTIMDYLISRWLIEASNKEDRKYIYERILLEHNQDVLDIHSEQFCLHKAIINRDLTLIRRLCKEDPDLLTETDGLGRTPLHMAAIELFSSNSDAGIADVIIENMIGRDLDLRRGDKISNWTWMDYCRMYLVRPDVAGAIVADVPDERVKTLMSLAVECGNEALSQLLSRYQYNL